MAGSSDRYCAPAELERLACVYLLTHNPTGLRYVGATRNFKQRLEQHFSPTHPPQWAFRLPAGACRFDMSYRALEVVPDGDPQALALAEFDWWTLLRPELQGSQMTPYVPIADLPKSYWPLPRLAQWVYDKEGRMRPLSSFYSVTTHAEAWERAKRIVREEVFQRRGHLLHTAGPSTEFNPIATST